MKKSSERRKTSVRSKINLSGKRPRLVVYRSNKYIYGQIVDDRSSKTLVSVSENSLGKTATKGKTKVQKAQLVGQELAKAASKKKIKEVVFDRGPYRYHGRVKALADEARKGGLKF